MIRIMYAKLRTIACVIDKQSDICRRYLMWQGLCVPGVETTTYLCNRFDTSFCAKDEKTNQAISNLNWKFWNKWTQIWVKSGGFSRGYPPPPPPLPLLQRNYEYHTFIWISTHILHVVYTTSLTEKIWASEKRLYIIVFLNRFMLILIYNNIYSIWCLVTFKEMLFFPS